MRRRPPKPPETAGLTAAAVKKRRPIRTALLVLGCYLLYLLVGMAAPFLVHPEVSAAFQQSFDAQSVYGGGSPDRAALVLENQQALDVRLWMIAQAEERILLSSFDIRDCESSRDLFSALLAAADRGVEIQILSDGANGLISMSTKPVFRALGRLPNVEIRFYNTPNLLLPWTFNGRMHDKYLIVDDRLLLLGGRNTFDLFLGDYVPDEEKSHDAEVLVVNTAAETAARESVLFQVEDYFYGVWDGPEAKTWLDGDLPLPGGTDRAEALLRERYAALSAARPGLFTGARVDELAFTVPVEKATLLYNPTHILSKEPWVWWQIQQLAQAAEDRVVLLTPYAVLNGPMYEGLGRIADKTTLLLNSTAVGDNFMASSDYTFNRGRVIGTGVTVAEWFGDYSIHGKAALFDDDLSMVGSYNWDMRSTYIDTELMLVFHGAAFADQVEAHLAELEGQSLVATAEGYLPKPGVEEQPLTGSKAVFYPVTSVVFQVFRFLL